MRVDGILGHERQLATLQVALRGDRLHHAWLFSGPPGIGKELVARRFARALLCQGEGLRPCEGCSACERSARRAHPDLITVRPERERVERKELSPEVLEGSPSKEIKIADLRALERRLHLPAHEGGHKVAMIVPAERMNLSAQNALLKTLEEPPLGCVLILVAGAAGALLPTVRSRCTRLPFFPLADTLVAQELVSRGGESLQAAQTLAALSGGSLGQALSLGSEAAATRAETLDGLESIVREGYPALMGVCASWAEDRDAVEFRLDLVASYGRDLLALASGCAPTQLRNLDRSDSLQELSANRPALEFALQLQTLEQGRADLARNGNLRLCLETTLSAFCPEAL